MATVVNDENIRIEKLTLGPWETNTYIAVCRKTQESVLIDAPAEAGRIEKTLEGTRPKYILLTHNHPDHIGALSAIHSKLEVPLAAHAADSKNLAVRPEILLNDGDTLTLGRLKIEVLHTPGHTPGSLCFKLGKYLLSGDSIFAGGPGMTSSARALKQIIESLTSKIFVLPDDTRIYPGHGDSTVLKKEKEEYAVFASRSHDPKLHGDIVWLTS
jgi:hydroxyacylglutathione hydrolase